MEHRVTLTVADLGRSEEHVERVLDTFLERHPGVGPVVSANITTGALSVTISLDADDLEDAHRKAAGILAAGMVDAGADSAAVLRIEIEPAEVAAPDAQRELEPA